MIPKPIEFYFDLSSPYAYLTSTWIDEVAAKHNRWVKWKPIMLGVAFKETGMKPLFHQPLRGKYGERDYLRSARLLGVQAVVPKRFPYIALAASRGFYWLEDNFKDHAVDFAKAAFRRYFCDGKAPTTDADIAFLAHEVGVPAKELIEASSSLKMKERLTFETEKAIQEGVFGSPFVIIDREPFWGNDRKDQIERWLKIGGW